MDEVTANMRHYWVVQGVKRVSKRAKRAAEFDRWLAEVRAKAWDEAMEYMDRTRRVRGWHNPYRQETE